MSETKTAVQKTTTSGAVTPPTAPNHSERFTTAVMREYGSNISGALQVTEAQKKLIQGYFIGIDRSLKAAEVKRFAPKNDLPYTWENVDLTTLAVDVVNYSRMGVDMWQPNHIFAIPYHNKRTGKYDITMMLGYNGIRYITERYAVDPPMAVTIELVYETDTFVPLKKSRDNAAETYTFDIPQPFNRGEIVGGFGYLEYDDPAKNKILFLDKAGIEKRKPKHASGEFWGGTKKEWTKDEKGKSVMTEVATDGWYEEMMYKTLVRWVFNSRHIPRDPAKIDDAYQHMKAREVRIAEMEVMTEIAENANAVKFDAPPLPHVETADIIASASAPRNTDDESAEPQGLGF